MSQTRIAQESFDTVVNGFTVSVTFTRTTSWSYENYGADADGNRGMVMLTLDDDFATFIHGSWEDAVTGNAHNDIPFDEMSKAFQLALTTAVDQWLDTHDAEPEEDPDEPDPDSEPDYDE